MNKISDDLFYKLWNISRLTFDIKEDDHLEDNNLQESERYRLINFYEEQNLIVYSVGHENIHAGFVSVIKDDLRRTFQIIGAFRGTSGVYDWMNNFRVNLIKNPNGRGNVHEGFKDGVEALVKEGMREKIIELYKKTYEGYESYKKVIYLTGHSKGGALATLMATYLKRYNPIVVTFGSPRVGDMNFRKGYKFTNYRYESYLDIVCHLPFTKEEKVFLRRNAIAYKIIENKLNKFISLGDFYPVGNRIYIYIKHGDSIFLEESRIAKENLNSLYEIINLNSFKDSYLSYIHNNDYEDNTAFQLKRYYETLQYGRVFTNQRYNILIRGKYGFYTWSYDYKENKMIRTPGIMKLSDDNKWYKHSYYETIKTSDIDGDEIDEIICRNNRGLYIFKYNIEKERWVCINLFDYFSNDNGWNQKKYYKTIQFIDMDKDKRAELIARNSGALVIYKYIEEKYKWKLMFSIDYFRDNNGWDLPEYYETIQSCNIFNDDILQILGRDKNGICIFRYIDNEWKQINLLNYFSDENGWNQKKYYKTIKCIDIDADGEDEILARYKDGLNIFKYIKENNQWIKLYTLENFSDENGWDLEEYYETIQYADINSDGYNEIIGRGKNGIEVYKYDEKENIVIDLGVDEHFSDDNGWNKNKYYKTIKCVDIDLDGRYELLARGKDGLTIYKYNEKWEELNKLKFLDDKIIKN